MVHLRRKIIPGKILDYLIDKVSFMRKPLFKTLLDTYDLNCS